MGPPGALGRRAPALLGQRALARAGASPLVRLLLRYTLVASPVLLHFARLHEFDLLMITCVLCCEPVALLLPIANC